MKCFTTSYWLSAVCVCEGIYVCRALLWWCMWCVYVICTCSCMGVRAGPHLYTESIFMRRFLSKCLTSLPVFFFLLHFYSLSFCLLIFTHTASNPLQPPTVSRCLSLALPCSCALRAFIFRPPPPPPIPSLPGIFLFSWNRCPFINKDLV